MTKAAYHPTSKAPLATEVDHARMQAILAKHAAPKIQVQVEKAGETPKAEPLKWFAPYPGSRGYYSQCHRYAVASVTVYGREYFETSKLNGNSTWYYPLAQGLKSFAEAEERAQADANGAL